MSDNLNLTEREKNELTGILYDEKKIEPNTIKIPERLII